MAARKRKIRRATLRGWWKPLPFLLLPFGIMFLFAWLEAQRLQTEYEVIELITDIRAINREIELLKDEHRELNRIELMDQQAPTLNMVEPDPEQRVILPQEVVTEALNTIRGHTGSALPDRLPPRAVFYDMRPAREPMHQAKEN